MSILDDENILMSGIKENMNNPFYSLKEIFMRADKENNGILHPYKNDILKLLGTIEIPQYTKWHINYSVIELVDSSYYGEPGDYYKIFDRINSYDSKTLTFNFLCRGIHKDTFNSIKSLKGIYKDTRKCIQKMLNDYNWKESKDNIIYKF